MPRCIQSVTLCDIRGRRGRGGAGGLGPPESKGRAEMVLVTPTIDDGSEGLKLESPRDQQCQKFFNQIISFCNGCVPLYRKF